jgi:hypothetical protein
MAARSAIACSLALLLFAPGDGAPPHLAEARALLDGGKAKEALDKAKAGLERAPDLPELLDLASRAAQAVDSNDEALWYGTLAMEQLAFVAAPGKDQKALSDGLQKRLAELDPLGQKGPAALSTYASALFAIGKDCASRKLYVNAVDLLSRCRTTPVAAAAEAELAKVYDNKKAVEALIDAGLDVPVKPKKKRSPGAVAKEDVKHSTWLTAWEIKGEQYTVKTDMGRDIAESMSLAMEQMNHYYRKVFHVKEHGGGQTARLTICVYKSRAEFDANEKENGQPVSPDVAGFFSPSENRVVTYDPRSDERALSFLWETLFHESSHQFTHLISADVIPAWLNEGTASYFEGARLRGNGVVETNLVPVDRLVGLEIELKEGHPTLEEVVTYFQPGSYPGEDYPFGWGLVYFLLNYEDERSQRVYVQPYHDFTAAYGRSGAKHDVKGRFIEHFVTKAKQPGVATFEDFDRRWADWIHKLYALYFGGPEVADDLIARARKEIKDKAWDSAEESYAWALRKRPGDPVAAFELAELLVSQKQADAAIYRYRGAAASLRTLKDPTEALPGSHDLTGTDLLELSEKQLAKLDKTFCEAKAKADTDLAAAAAAAARGYAEQKLPLCALRLLDVSLALHGRATALSELRDEIAAKSGADTRRWRRLKIEGELAEWEADEGWEAKDGVLSGTSDHSIDCVWRDELPERFGFEARFDGSGLEKASGLCGLVFGVNDQGLALMVVRSNGAVQIGDEKKGADLSPPIAVIKPSQLKSFTLAIEVWPDRVQFFVDGKPAGKLTSYEPEDLRGRIGLLLQGGSATVSDVRVRY